MNDGWEKIKRQVWWKAV